MYSLVSAPVLGFDLTRLDGGAATAAVLSRALRLTPGDLPALARRLPDDGVRARLWQDIHGATILRPTIRGLAQQETEGAIALLERAPIGTPDALLHCVRHDVLDWTWSTEDGVRGQDEIATRATAVVCDAVMATYLRELLPADTRRRLAVGWLAAVRELPEPPVDAGPQHEAVMELCRRVATLGAGDVERLSALADRTRSDGGSWSKAVHSASWAVHTSDRVRAAAAAQFELVQSVDSAGIPVAERAGGVWNLLSGAVHALTVADMIESALVEQLLDPCLSVLGLPVPS
ncbi:hypothetical protein [Planobispora longispora]|uniref:Uncharacterized protein n=1 Tax=Planobispora longispora TaxID=28887 RepID=A0A8J3RW63_9ACTN|nr:hypothetical protein [Planobispora longispora]GIH81057.1 hypothetical protein Plo01_74860 [Planobispora longispora]